MNKKQILWNSAFLVKRINDCLIFVWIMHYSGRFYVYSAAILEISQKKKFQKLSAHILKSIYRWQIIQLLLWDLLWQNKSL